MADNDTSAQPAVFNKATGISAGIAICVAGIFVVAAERVTSLEVSLSALKDSMIKIESSLSTYASRDDVKLIFEAQMNKAILEIHNRMRETESKVSHIEGEVHQLKESKK